MIKHLLIIKELIVRIVPLISIIRLYYLEERFPEHRLGKNFKEIFYLAKFNSYFPFDQKKNSLYYLEVRFPGCKLRKKFKQNFYLGKFYLN
jgi:hypothetical protein